MKYRAEQLGYEEEFRGLGLTSRKNLCLHPSVKREKSGAIVDSRCRSLTAGFVKEKKERGENVDVCVYHDVRLPDRHEDATANGLKLEPRPARTSQSHPKRRMVLREHLAVWRRAQAVPLLHCKAHGSCPVLPLFARRLHFANRCNIATSLFSPTITYSTQRLLSASPKISPKIALLSSTKLTTSTMSASKR